MTHASNATTSPSYATPSMTAAERQAHIAAGWPSPVSYEAFTCRQGLFGGFTVTDATPVHLRRAPAK